MSRGRLMLVAILLLHGLNHQLLAQEPVSVGLNQLEIIRPGNHERALPDVEFRDLSDSGRTLIDIPRTLHVHRFYYDGDREYQGPIVHGGPITVVANHPKYGEQLYVDVSLPNGAPVIAYSKSAITYVYPDRRVIVKFSPWKRDGVRVIYRSGQGAARTREDRIVDLKARCKEAHESSRLGQAVHGSVQGAKSMAIGAKDAVDNVAGGLVEGSRKIVAMIPGAAALRSYGDSAAQRRYENSVRFAEHRADSNQTPLVTTNR
ncbi:MAG: hypothetical protein KDB27_31720, partial [Planctomycetales bacterium]|nr:hypothetical protein [Planctomycetales bacterium]